MPGPLNVAVTGTFDPNNVAVIGKPVGGSGVTFKDCGDTDFDARTCIQKSINLYSEVNSFVGGLAAALGVPGYVVLAQVEKIISDMRRTPSAGERAYAP